MRDVPPGPLLLRVTLGAPGIHIVELLGELDHDTGDLLVDTVRQVLDDRRPAEVRLDCAGLDLGDSSGLSALLMTLRHCDAAGVRLRLTNQSEGLARVLSVTGIAALFGDPPAPSPEPLLSIPVGVTSPCRSGA